jgi:hypothetical protein
VLRRPLYAPQSAIPHQQVRNESGGGGLGWLDQAELLRERKEWRVAVEFWAGWELGPQAQFAILFFHIFLIHIHVIYYVYESFCQKFWVLN